MGPFGMDFSDSGKVRAKRAKSKVRAKSVLNENIQNKATKSVFIIIELHNYGKCIFSNVFLTNTIGLKALVCDQHNPPTSETSKVKKADFC
jgi:hypothetical protein